MKLNEGNAAFVVEAIEQMLAKKYRMETDLTLVGIETNEVISKDITIYQWIYFHFRFSLQLLLELYFFFLLLLHFINSVE